MTAKLRENLDPDDVHVRRASARDEPFLRQMLSIAASWREPGAPPPDVAIPVELLRYTGGFGRHGDHGFVAICDGADAGAAWCRLLVAPEQGYGYVADDVPELSVALLPRYRGRRVGAALIERLLEEVTGDYPAVSLSVEPDNPARALYERLGFKKVAEGQGSWTMVKPLPVD